ncbi:MAG TPA: hypothetical protein VJ962_12700 [Clostridia bacterium]|nr:hypothetical protein [Clostridia bacterium]
MKNLILLFVFALGFTTTTIGQESLEDRYAEKFILISAQDLDAVMYDSGIEIIQDNETMVYLYQLDSYYNLSLLKMTLNSIVDEYPEITQETTWIRKDDSDSDLYYNCKYIIGNDKVSSRVIVIYYPDTKILGYGYEIK